MSRPVLLDLFCGGGGSSVGYHRAGFEVVGVDHRPQKRYPFEFVQADALQYLAAADLSRFAWIAASPPCQAYSIANNIHQRQHPRLIASTRAALRQTGLPYVIENVPGSPLLHPVMLCGLMFGLRVFRHRLFESEHLLLAPPHEPHGERRIGRGGFCCVAGHGDCGRGRVPSDHRHLAAWKAAMGIDWLSRDELAQAVPPAYTFFLGQQMLGALKCP